MGDGIRFNWGLFIREVYKHRMANTARLEGSWGGVGQAAPARAPDCKAS